MKWRRRILAFALAVAGLVLTPGTAHAAPPANDDFASAITIPALPYGDSKNTTDATTQLGEPDPSCGEVEDTIWYRFTAPENALLAADTFGSDTFAIDTVLGVWTGGSPSLVEVACNDDTFGLNSQVLFKAVAGTTYHFQIGNLIDPGGGAVEFHLVERRPLVKGVDLSAKPARVAEGKKTTLTATVSPCAGHAGDNVEFLRGTKTIVTKATDSDCVAKLKVKMNRSRTFRARSPEQDGDHAAGESTPVKVTVKK